MAKRPPGLAFANGPAKLGFLVASKRDGRHKDDGASPCAGHQGAEKTDSRLPGASWEAHDDGGTGAAHCNRADGVPLSDALVRLQPRRSSEERVRGHRPGNPTGFARVDGFKRCVAIGAKPRWLPRVRLQTDSIADASHGEAGCSVVRRTWPTTTSGEDQARRLQLLGPSGFAPQYRPYECGEVSWAGSTRLEAGDGIE